MASIYEINQPPRPEPRPEPKKRGKNRETLSPAQLAEGKRTLMNMVTAAFTTLEDAMNNADYSTAVKAAQVILDRSGFGPKSTVDVNTTTVDLSSLSREELAERASRVVGMLKDRSRSPEKAVTH